MKIYTSQMTPSYVHDNLHKIKKINKTTFYRILSSSLIVSAIFALIYIMDGDFNNALIWAIFGFIGTFILLSALVFIQQLFFMILNKIKIKKQHDSAPMGQMTTD